MSIFVVCRRALLRELITTYCAANELQVEACFEALALLPDEVDTATVVYHVGAGEADVVEQIAEFRGRMPEARMVILASPFVMQELEPSLRNFADAVLPDDSSPQLLKVVVTAVHEGFRLSPTDKMERGARPALPLLDARPVSRGRSEEMPDVLALSSPVRLSTRELTVMRKLREGASNKDIANALDIVESTVKVHLRACYRKIGVRNRTQAALWAAQNLP